MALTTSATAALKAVDDLLGSNRLNEVRASLAVSTCFLNEASSGKAAVGESLEGMMQNGTGILNEKEQGIYSKKFIQPDRQGT